MSKIKSQSQNLESDNNVVNYDQEVTPDIDAEVDVENAEFDQEADDFDNPDLFESIDEIIYKDFENKLNDYEQKQESKLLVNSNPLSITLEQAVQDFQNGEKEAFDYIYNHYKPKLERLSYRQNDEDLVQELSIILLKAVETFNISGGAKFNTYYWKCARNHMGTLNIRKNAKKRTAQYGVISMQQSFNSKDSEVELEAFVKDKNEEFNAEQNMFHMILEENIYPHLKENDVKAIQMLLDGYTLEEIGAALGGITAPAVHVKFRRLADKKNVGKQLRLLYEMYNS